MIIIDSPMSFQDRTYLPKSDGQFLNRKISFIYLFIYLSIRTVIIT